MDEIIISYQVVSAKNNVKQLARKIAIEQSVETPESLITDAIEESYLGQLQSIEQVANHIDTFKISLAYPEKILSKQYNQLLNLCFGNVSMYPDVKLVDIAMPDRVINNFSGPRYGVEGVRAKLGVYGRPLLATALKPRGYSDQQFATMCKEFALGGGDIIKDDQNLIGSFDQFKSRVIQCLAALNEVKQETGKTCLYFPFVSAPFEVIEEYFSWLKEQGVQGVLMAPLILGLDTARGLAAKYDLIYMAHPSFTGSYCVPSKEGMSYHLLYGLLYRLAGVDISVYPNTGGRFLFSEKDCKHIADSLRTPLAKLKTAFPCTAGGMQYADLPRMCEWYQKDAVFLLGGSLLEYSPSLERSTAAFKQALTNSFEEEIVQPPNDKSISACEYPNHDKDMLLEYIKFNNFNWQGRQSSLYKETGEASFKNIKRIELIGNSAESCNFDLRYFEISHQGYSSKEMHHHTHVIIVARGQGIVVIDNREYLVKQNDVLYIKPKAVHQLLNPEKEPFGFYCIVNRDRDKPTLV